MAAQKAALRLFVPPGKAQRLRGCSLVQKVTRERWFRL